ncbi:DNA phosphorothioation-dependent restriction pro tein DptG [Microcella alkaliphila]|uniref:DNA phosphorothioation-dependent restriction pro tein DptG n=1 Tax=Microcella alkaliphila TaxID=279828 RepID=A0A0U5BPN8_9MICO|nr:DNA phosphorothioation-dependent restriction pro tein DptG [Microcella alkaliphila]
MKSNAFQNPVLDLERAELVNARHDLGTMSVPAWPRTDKDLRLVELEADWVRFSTLNHRTRAEQRAEVARRRDEDLFTGDPLGLKAQAAQYEILQAQDGFPELKLDLRERGQQEPAIVTADGILINGNRRAAALRSLYIDDNHLAARYVKCLVLPADATSGELIDLETELQIARDFKQEYSWINEALLIEELFERENKDFDRVAKKMHRPKAEVQSLYDKLQQVHQLVDLSGGARQHIDFNGNEAAFEELSKHIKNKQPAEAEAVRSVYFIGTLAEVPYRKLRHLRRADAASLVRQEIENEPALSPLLKVAQEDAEANASPGLLDEVLGGTQSSSPLASVLKFLATKKPDEAVQFGESRSVEVKDILDSLQSAIGAVADEAREEHRDQEFQSAPIMRVQNAIQEFQRAVMALPKAREFPDFDESAVIDRIRYLKALVDQHLSGS